MRKGLGVVVLAEGITVLFFLVKHCDLFVMPLALGFLGTACALISLRRLSVEDRERSSLRWRDGFWVGLAQGIALVVPGVSRLALTYVAGRWSGLNMQSSFYFSALVQIPLCGGAALLGTSALWKAGQLGMIFSNGGWLSLTCATIGAYLLLWMVEWMMRRDVIGYLGLYMLFPAMYAFFLK